MATAAPDPTWDEVVRRLPWDVPPRETWTPGDGWFPGGRLDLSVAALDQHLADRGSRTALHWEGEPGDRRALTYHRLHTEVVALAAALRGLGIGPGDRVALSMGLVPETVITMLACARVGAPYAILPAVLPIEALADRLDHLRPRLVVTQDGAWRHGVLLPLKSRVDEAVSAVGTIEHGIVVRRTGVDVAWYEGDRWFHDLVAHVDPADGGPAPVPADHPHLVTYLANRRGRPAGLVHGTAGLAAYTSACHAALCPEPDDVLWTPSEVAWLATQTHGILGPLLAGGTAVVYEGMLDVPTPQRTWEIVARHGVTTLLATPSVVRALRRWGNTPPDADTVASLGRIVTAGEPMTDDTESWLADTVGRGRIEVTNAWGQTELGGMVALTTPSPMADRLPDAGLQVVDGRGTELPAGEIGDLVLTRPWPAVAHAVERAFDEQGPPERKGSAGSVGPAVHHGDHPITTGDRARWVDGGLEVVGRSDRVFSVSGQLVSATEVADVLAEHPWVTRAEVVDRPDSRRGRAVVAFVMPAADAPDDQDVVAGEVTDHVRETLGGLATPRAVAIVSGFPEADAETRRRGLESLAGTIDRTTSLTVDQVSAAYAATGPR